MIPETLSIVERQILANQFRILSKITDNDDDYETKIEILENGYTEQYYEIFEVDTEEIPIEICEETSQILNMYRRINAAVKKLSLEEKNELDLEKIKFEGFDANNDPHYHYMTFLVEKMNLWREYRSEYLNAHSRFPILKYRKMLDYQNYLLDNDQYDLRKEDLEYFIEMLDITNEENTIQLVR
jgi:uncharacterized protein